MGHGFDARREVELPATPEQVWNAIATGPGIDSWFMGRSDVQPGEGGVVSTAFGGYAPAHRITAWEPGRRLAYRSAPEDDGRYIAYEFLVEGRGSGSTVLRIVTSGFLPGDDWEDEFEAMTQGGDLFIATLVAYLTHFGGRTGRPVTAFGPPVDDWQDTWRRLDRALGVDRPAPEGAPVTLPAAAGTPGAAAVYFSNSQTLGVRTADALYRFLQGFRGPLIASHHLFAEDADAADAERSWAEWLHRLPERP